MSRIVLIHGIGQENRSAESLLADWFPALCEGVSLAGGPPPEPGDVAMAFYGDVFRTPDGGPDEPDLAAADVTDPLDQALLAEWWRAAASADPVPPAPGSETAPEPRTPMFIQRALNALGRTGYFDEASDQDLIRSPRQIRGYLTEPAAKAATECLAKAVEPGTRVVVAHSLGSLIAYEALCAHPEWPVETLITLGSPLGSRGVVFDRLTPEPQDGSGAWPGSVRTWVNIADHGDVLAAEKSLARWFGPRVVDVAISGGSQAFSAKSYLSARETGAALTAALGPEQ